MLFCVDVLFDVVIVVFHVQADFWQALWKTELLLKVWLDFCVSTVFHISCFGSLLNFIGYLYKCRGQSMTLSI